MSRKKYGSEFKFKLVLETVKRKNVSAVAREYDVNVNLLSRWRKDFLDQGHRIFETTPDKEAVQLKKHVANLERLLGKKEVELGLLKNFADFYDSRNGS